MTSQALTRWNTERASALDRLEAIHTQLTGGLRGRPRELTELNHALFLRLAAEIQGFCRDLHDEAIDAVCTPVQIPSVSLRGAFRTVLTNGRKLDQGNAGPDNIGNDWTRLGMQLWPDLRAAYPGPQGAALWNKRLAWLNKARNGIAHHDVKQIEDARAAHPLTLNTFRQLRKQLSRFATGLDRTTDAYLVASTGKAPW